MSALICGMYTLRVWTLLYIEKTRREDEAACTETS